VIRFLCAVALVSMAVTSLVAAPATPRPIPVPECLGVFLWREDNTLQEIPPRVPSENDRRGDPLSKLTSRTPLGALLGQDTPVLKPTTRLVIYEPNWPMRAYVFAHIAPNEGRRYGILVPRLRPSRDVPGLYEVTWREPLEPGILLIAPLPMDALEFTPLPHWVALVTESGEIDTHFSEVIEEERQRAPLEDALSGMRAMATALESYRVDWNVYPPDTAPHLTSPIAYFVGLPRDPFVAPGAEPFSYRRFSEGDPLIDVYGAYVITSPGPDGDRDLSLQSLPLTPWNSVFDPTNGVTSGGDLLRAPRTGTIW
jgi:hypothetical protein